MAKSQVVEEQALAIVDQNMALAKLSEVERMVLEETLQTMETSFDYRPDELEINAAGQMFTRKATGEVTLKPVEVVILDARKMRAYWDKDDEDEKAPLCRSDDCKVGRCRTATGEYTRKCSQCPFNEWGSAVDDKGAPSRGKACKEMRWLLVLFPEQVLPIFVSLPPTSITNFDTYASGLLATPGTAFYTVVTRVKLEKAQHGNKVYSIGSFEIVRKLTEAETRAVLDARRKYGYLLMREPEIGDYLNGNGNGHNGDGQPTDESAPDAPPPTDADMPF